MTSLRLLSCVLAAWLPAATAGQALTLTLTDGHDFVRYGQTLDYIVTLTNDGDATAATPLSMELSPAWDPAGASWVCYPGTDGATCTASGSGPLHDTPVLPPGARVSWVVSAPTVAETPETTAMLGVIAVGAAPLIDTNTLVVFKDGFDTPYGDGTQDLPPDGS